MKNKKLKVSQKRNFLVIPILVFIIFLSTAYALFNDSLTINGVASTVEYYEGEKLPVLAVIRDSSNNRYYTQDITQKGLSFSSESWQADTYSLNMKKAFATSGGDYVDVSWRYYTEEAKATISYDVQRKRRYMYFIVKYTT